MALKLMYITNEPDVARIAEDAGVDRIWVDLEYIGKSKRQGGMDTVQSHHTIDDIRTIRKAVTKSQVLVRVNSIHGAAAAYGSSEQEIQDVIDAGADVVMLPYFKTVEEVSTFLRLVDGRARTQLLLETPESVEIVDEILRLPGVDEIHIGLNDLSLGYGMKFMFQLLADGTVERLCGKFRAAGIPYGFGGIAALGKGALPAERVIAEHYRLGSTCAILSRSFCNTGIITDRNEIREVFQTGVSAIRAYEAKCAAGEIDFETNQAAVCACVQMVCDALAAKEQA